MKIRILLASLFLAGVTGTGFAQDGITEQDAHARLEGSKQLQSDYDTYNSGKEELLKKGSEITNEANIDLESNQPFEFQHEKGDFDVKVEREDDGDFMHSIEGPNSEWKYKAEGDEVKEKFENGDVEYQYEKNGTEVKEKIESSDIEYKYKKDQSEVKEQYEGPNKEWSINKKANGETTIQFEDDVEEYEFQKNEEGQTSIDYKKETGSETIKVEENFDGSGKIEYESDDLQNSKLRQQIDLKKEIKSKNRM